MFSYFGIQYFPEEVSCKIIDKCITHSIFRIQDDDSIICGTSCIAFVGIASSAVRIKICAITTGIKKV